MVTYKTDPCFICWKGTNVDQCLFTKNTCFLSILIYVKEFCWNETRSTSIWSYIPTLKCDTLLKRTVLFHARKESRSEAFIKRTLPCTKSNVRYRKNHTVQKGFKKLMRPAPRLARKRRRYVRVVQYSYNIKIWTN